MVHYEFSNVVLTCINFFAMLLSFIPISGAIYIFVQGPVSCEDQPPGWRLSLGIFLLVMSVVGMIGATRKSRTIILVYMWFFLAVVFITAVMMLVVTVVAVASSPGDLEKANREFELKEFIPVVRNYAAGEEKWVEIKACMVQQGFCRMRVNYTGDDEDESAKQLSCCRPPTHCGFESVKNGTMWVLPEDKMGLGSKENHDCVAWSNDIEKVCYDCDSCKAAHVAIRVIEWHGDLGFCIMFVFFLLIVFAVAFCTSHNSRENDDREDAFCTSHNSRENNDRDEEEGCNLVTNRGCSC